MLKNFINPIFFCGNYKLLEIFIIGLIGAVPMAFVSLNVIVWLKESGIERVCPIDCVNSHKL